MGLVGIVGSGHAGVAAAKGLVKRGFKPVILDVGEELDAQRQAVVDVLARQDHSDWDASTLAHLTENTTVNSARPMRLAYGSDYIYARHRPWAKDRFQPHEPAPTFAKGGYSNVWGGAMLPADPSDLVDWPSATRDLSKWYREVLSEIPVSGIQDDLESNFPLYCQPNDAVETQPVVQDFLRSLKSSSTISRQENLAFGRSRLAVRTTDDASGLPCTYCGRCLSGCVYGAIQSSATDLNELVAANKVEYVPRFIVQRFEERDEKIWVHGISRTRSPLKLDFKHVFLAAGAISSSRIFMASEQLFDQELKLQMTQGFVAPIFKFKHSGFEWPKSNTLTAMFLELKVPELSPFWVHVQVSQANELVLKKIKYQETSRALLNRVKRRVLGHLMVAFFNLHSHNAAHYGLGLSKGEGEETTLTVKLYASETYPLLSKAVGRRLTKLLIPVGAVPLLMFKHGDTERPQGWHFGGTTPMTDRPRMPWETDLFGIPKNWKRLSIVDSSVFPSLPATTVALLAMANSRRIASEVPMAID